MKTLHTEGVVFALVVFRIGHIRRIVSLAQVVGVISVNRVTHKGFVPEMFHDVDFAAKWPMQGFRRLRQHPNGRPVAMRPIELGPNLNAPKAKRFAVFAPNTTRQKWCFIVGDEGVGHATKHKVAVLESVKRVVRTHVDGPIGIVPPNLRPNQSV